MVLATLGWRCGKKSVIRVALCVVAIVMFMDPCTFFRMYIASLIHLLPLSDSLSKTVEAGQLMVLLTFYICFFRPISCYVSTLLWQALEKANVNNSLLMKVSNRNRNVEAVYEVVIRMSVV